MPSTTKGTDDAMRETIDAISQSVRINGAESEMADFCLNFLAANIDALVELWDQDDDDRIGDADGSVEKL